MKEEKVIDLSGLFVVLLTLVFITLRLCGVIAWSWWWVLSPIWIPVVMGITITLIGLVVMLKKRKKQK